MRFNFSKINLHKEDNNSTDIILVLFSICCCIIIIMLISTFIFIYITKQKLTLSQKRKMLEKTPG